MKKFLTSKFLLKTTPLFCFKSISLCKGCGVSKLSHTFLALIMFVLKVATTWFILLHML